MNVLHFICITVAISSVYGGGELTILHHPNGLLFKGHEHTRESLLKEVYSAALGFSTEEYSNWDGLFIDNPFDLPEALVVVAVDGVSHLGYKNGRNFPLHTDEEEVETFSSLQKRVLERYPESGSQLVYLNLAGGLQEVQKYKILREIHPSKKAAHHFLKNSVEEDREFLKEVNLLSNIVDSVEHSVKIDSIPDVFWFKVSSLHALNDLYGDNSTQVKEAKTILNDAILKLNTAFNKIYHGKVLVSVITSDAVHTRRTRNILQAAPADETNLNLAKFYNKDYPVIFNIILWFGVVMVFSLLAICIAIGAMDPGRDSIIYRMTSTRLKKDN